MTTSGEAAHAAMEAGAVQRPAEFARLLEMVEGRRELLGRESERLRVLEIGSYKGGTLAGYRTMWPRAFVVAVDLPDPPDRELLTWGARVIEADSHELETLEAVREALTRVDDAAGFDLVFVDGDHALEGAIRDVVMYGDLVRPAGLLALHDVTPFNEGRSEPLGPDLLWRMLKAGMVPGWTAYAEIVDPMPEPDGRGPWWGGIGVAVKS